ncbi:MAG TPA: GNAT family N-acetyltransferase [bacterium]
MPADAAITIRTAVPEDAPGLATMHSASWAHAYKGIIPDEHLAAQTPERRLTQWQPMLAKVQAEPETQTVFVGVDAAGGVQGFVHGGVERVKDTPWQGEIYALYLHPTNWRRALGSRLVGHMAAWLAARGHGTMRLWVLEQNPARGFYERIGGRLLTDTNEVAFGAVKLQHWSYGWDDVAALAARLPR